jgi:hypothetical protein
MTTRGRSISAPEPTRPAPASRPGRGRRRTAAPGTAGPGRQLVFRAGCRLGEVVEHREQRCAGAGVELTADQDHAGGVGDHRQLPALDRLRVEPVRRRRGRGRRAGAGRACPPGTARTPARAASARRRSAAAAARSRGWPGTFVNVRTALSTCSRDTSPAASASPSSGRSVSSACAAATSAPARERRSRSSRNVFATRPGRAPATASGRESRSRTAADRTPRCVFRSPATATTSSRDSASDSAHKRASHSSAKASRAFATAS